MPKSHEGRETSRSSSKSARVEGSTLRPLAPKPQRIVPQPRTTSSDASSGRQSPTNRRAPPVCQVCLRAGCQLATHKAYMTSLRSTTTDQSKPEASLVTEPGFLASYAFGLGLQYTNTDMSTAEGTSPYSLPVKPELDTPEMHQLFHYCEMALNMYHFHTDLLVFTVESQSVFRIPRPSQIVGDLLCGPFFLPAMQDPALCLSILAAASAIIPCRTGAPARNITSLTLFGETMQLMRERVDSNPKYIDDNTIVAATILWAVNAWLEDAAALKSHGESVVAFVQARGGLSELGLVGAVAQLIRWVDLLSSMILNEPCHFVTDPSPVWVLDAPVPAYGFRWADVTATQMAGLDTHVVLACQQTCRLIERLEQADLEGPSAAQFSFIVQDLCYTSTKEATLKARYHGAHDLNECICLANTLIKIKCFYGHDSLDMLTNAISEELVVAVRKTGDLQFWSTHLDLMVWLLFVALLVPSNSGQGEWVLDLLEQILTTRFGCSKPWPLDIMAEIKSLLHSFTWSEIHLSVFFDAACKLLESGA